MKLQITAVVNGKTYLSAITESFESVRACHITLLELPEMVMGLEDGTTLVLRTEVLQHTHFIIKEVL